MDAEKKGGQTQLPHATHGLLKRIHEHWGWVVTISVSVIWFLIIGFHYVYALTFLKLQEDFQASATVIGFIGSLYLSLGCCLSPLTSFLQRYYSHRTITILSIVLTAVSYVVSSFMQSVIYLVFTFAVLSGIGYNLAYTSLHHILVCYFPSKRCRGPIAIANLGPTLALLCLSPLIENLLSMYGWRWTLRIQGFVIFVFGLLACTVLKKPPVWKKTEKQEKASGNNRHSGYLTKVLTLPEAWMFCFSSFLNGVASTFLYVFIGSYVVSKGVSEEQSGFAMTLTGFGSLAVCFIGALTNRITFPIIYLLPVVSVLTSITFFILICVNNIIPVLIMCFVIGLLRTGYNILIVPPAVELLGSSRALEASTLSISSLGVGYIVGAYVSGKMFDAFGSYDVSLYICAGIYLAAAVLALMAPLYQRTFAPDRYMVDRKFTDLKQSEKNDLSSLTNVKYDLLLIERETVI